MKELEDRYIEEAKNVIDIEVNALKELKHALDQSFFDVVELITHCKGKVILCGMGKSGHVAKKISATMSSLGTSSFFLHPAEAQHGDMGMVSTDDVIILISNSGESEEVIRILPSIKVIGAKTIAITSKKKSTLARECDYVQIMPDCKEACNLNLAPTSSTTMVMAYGDALAVVASQVYGFTKEDFRLFHPSGTLGKKLILHVSDLMVTGDDIPIVKIGCGLAEAIVEMSEKTLGMLLVVNQENQLIGLLTDGDLRRAIERKVDLYEGIIDDVMTVNPQTIREDMSAVQALNKLKENKINNYPVVDTEKRIVGAITWQMIVRAGIV